MSEICDLMKKIYKFLVLLTKEQSLSEEAESMRQGLQQV
jgi:hypothetical protein